MIDLAYSSAKLLNNNRKESPLAQYNPIYGELLSSREVADLTGFTMNQLRNHRQRPDTSPFPFVRIGGTSLYRKTDINAWIEQNGGLDAVYIALPHQIATPLEIAEDNAEKREAMNKIKLITTENAWTSMATWAIEQSGIENGTKVIHDEGRRLLALERGLSEWKDLPTPAKSLQATDADAFWKIWTYGVRRVFVIANQLDVTDEELLQVPVGAIPPLKTK